MAPTKSAGRVSIRVVPDSTRFRQDLEKSLNRIERTLVAKIRAELYLDRESLVKLKKQIESLVIRIKPHIDLQVGRDQIAEVKAQVEAMEPKVNVDLETKEAARRMAALSRTRKAKLQAEIEYEREAQAALAGIKRILGRITVPLSARLSGLAGFNVVRDTFKEGSEFITNLDRNAVKFGRMATLISGAVSGIGTTLGGLVTVGHDLAALAGVGWLAPAFLTGLGVGIGVLVVALKDMKTRLADLGPGFTKLQDDISNAFWNEAEKPIREMVKSLLPELNKHLSETGKQFGRMFKDLADGLKETVTPEYLERVFSRMNKAIDTSRGAVKPLIRAFATLGDVGSKYFDRFASWIVDLSVRFDNFLAKAAADGRLDAWVERAIEGFKDLGRTIRGLSGMLGAIDRAAREAGSGGLDGLANALERAAAVMNGDRFQASLQTFFRGVYAGFDGIIRGIKQIGPALEKFMPSFERIMGTVGNVFDKLGTILAKFIGNSRLHQGLEDFFKGIEKAIDNLMPAIDPLAASLGGLFSLMGRVLPDIARLISEISIKWGPVFDRMLEKIEPLIPKLVDLASVFIDKLTPVFEKFVDEVLPPLIDLFIALLPHIETLLTLATPVLATILTDIGNGLKEMAKGMEEFNKWAEPGTEFLRKLGETMSKLKGYDFGSIGATLAANFGVALGINSSPLSRVFAKWLADNLIPMGENLKTFTDGIVRFFTNPIDFATQFGATLARNPLGAVFLKFLDDQIRSFGINMPAFVSGVARLFSPEGLKTLATEIGTNLAKFFENLPKTLEIIWETFWSKVKSDFQRKFKEIFGFGGSGDGVDPAKITGSVVGGKGRAVGGAINFDDPQALISLDNFKMKLDEKWAALWAGITLAKDTFFGQFMPSFSGFLGQAETGTANTTTNMGLSFATKFAEMGSTVETFKTNALVAIGTWAAQTAKDAETGTSGAKNSTVTNIGTMASTVAGWVAGNIPLWQTAFNTFAQTTQTKTGEAQRTTSSNLGSMAGTVAAKASEIGSNLQRGMSVAEAAVRGAFMAMKPAAEGGVRETAATAGTLPGRSQSAMGNLNSFLSGSGAALIGGFAAGIRGAIGLATSAASWVVTAVRALFPFSPAKKGPFSGTGYTSFSGRALVKDFAGGMMDNISMVRNNARKVADAAQIAASDLDLDWDPDNPGVTIERNHVEVVSYNPVAEPTSRTIEKAHNAIKMR